MRFLSSRRKGFTLIEVMVVVAVIGILSSIVIASLGESRAKARDAQRISDLEQIRLALRLYKDKNGTYPKCGAGAGARIGRQQNGDPWPQPPGCPDSGTNSNNVNGVILPEFFPKVPDDPSFLEHTKYQYFYDSTYNCPAHSPSSVTVLFARTMESDTNMNWNANNGNEKICNSGFTTAYGIILGPAVP